MDRLGKELLEELDDASFCEALVSLLQNYGGPGLALLYEEWVLARLRLVKQRAARLYFGLFLTPLRTAFPGQVYPPDIMAAMQSVATEPQIGGGDLVPTAFAAAIEDVFLNGLPRAHSPGYASLEQFYRPRLGEWSVVTGVSSHMKSTFVLSLALQMAKLHGWNFALFTQEHHPLGAMGSWYVEAYAGQPQHALSTEERTQAISWITDHFHCIDPDDETQPTLDWILAVARHQKRTYGLEGLIIDPWNEVEHCYDNETETKYTSSCLSRIRRFAQRQNMHVWIIAHPTKMKKAESGAYKGKYPPPTPYDINGSANWYNKPDACLSIWRDAMADSPEVEVHVQKVRNRGAGQPGMATLRYDGRRFHDPGDMTQPPHWTD